MIKITKRISFYEIEFDKLQEVVPLLDELSYTQYKSDDAIPYGYLLSTKNKRVRVPIGVGDFEVRKRLKNVVSFEYDDACIPSKPSTGYTFKAEAKSEQDLVLRDLKEEFRLKNACVCNMQAGRGKTFVFFRLAYELRRRAIIFLKTNLLLEEMVAKLKGYTDIKNKNIAIISNSSDIYELDESLKHDDELDFILLTHAMFREIVKKPDGFRTLMAICVKAGISLKCYDEADLETQNVFFMELRSTIKSSIYLTATFYKSSKDENRAFQYAFGDLKRIGAEYYQDFEKRRDAKVIKFTTDPSPKEIRSWEIYGTGDFNVFNYADYLIKRKWYELGLAITDVVDEIKDLLVNRPETVSVIFLNKAEVEIVQLFIEKVLVEMHGFDRDIIGVVNSKVGNDKTKKQNKTKPIIVTTMQSLGRGVDMSNMALILNLAAHASGRDFEQLLARLGREGGIDGLYREVVDEGCYKVLQWYDRRKPLFKTSFRSFDEVRVDTSSL